MKIIKYELTLRIDSETDHFWKSPGRGAIMHGILNQAISDSNLHINNQSRPYTQNLRALEYGRYLWSINILNEAMAKSLLDWLESRPQNLFCEHHETNIIIEKIDRVFERSYKDFADEILTTNDFSRFGTFTFATPLLFKKSRSNHYNPYPDIENIFSSLWKKWQLFSEETFMSDENIVSDIVKFTHIREFRLTSSKIAMDSTNLIGSKGYLSFVCSGPTNTLMMLSILTQYSKYAGIGAKTSMGLGCVYFEPQLKIKNKLNSLKSHNGLTENGD